MIAAQWKRLYKAVNKILPYYSVHKRFPNEVGKELEKLYLANVQITAQVRDFSLKCYSAVQFPLLSLKVQLVFCHTRSIYFIMKQASKQTINKILAFYLNKEKVILKCYLFKEWFVWMSFYFWKVLSLWSILYSVLHSAIQSKWNCLKDFIFCTLYCFSLFFFLLICSSRKTQKLCFAYALT